MAIRIKGSNARVNGAKILMHLHVLLKRQKHNFISSFIIILYIPFPSQASIYIFSSYLVLSHWNQQDGRTAVRGRWEEGSEFKMKKERLKCDRNKMGGLGYVPVAYLHHVQGLCLYIMVGDNTCTSKHKCWPKEPSLV